MTGLLVALTLAGGSYTAEYPRETAKAVQWCTDNPWAYDALEEKLGSAELALWALCTVAPELGQWSTLRTKIELYTLKAVYVQEGRGNFSVGPFQMKPSFAERMEKLHPSLRLSGDSPREERIARLERLSSAEGQLPYLVAFMKQAVSTVDSWGVQDPVMRFRYIATLYNAGLDISREKADELLRGALFPRFGLHKFNYADAAASFIPLIKQGGSE